MGFTPSYLGHVNIYVRNAKDAREWYESVLGLHTYDFMEGCAAFMYDMQHAPAIRDEMTYISPTTGDRVGDSFITPRTREDLDARHVMMRH